MDEYAWVEDRHGDVQAARYGGPSRAQVPRHHRTGAGRVLGLNDGLRIARFESAKAGGLIVLPAGKQRSRYVDDATARRLYTSSAKRLKTSATKDKDLDISADFIRIAASTWDTRDTTGHGASAEWIGHRFAVGERPDAPADAAEHRNSSGEEDVASDSGSEMEGESKGELLQREAKALDERTRRQPTDTDAWLRLAQLQADLLHVSTTKTRAYSKSHSESEKQQRAIAEVQISVLERALHADHRNASSTSLRTARLKITSKYSLWDHHTIEKEWFNEMDRARKILSDPVVSHASHAKGFVDACLSWLRWEMEEDGVSSVTKSLATCGRVIEAFKAAYFSTPHSTTKEVLEQAYLGVLKDVVKVFDEAGYREHGTGVLQAASELSLNRPAAFAIDSELAFASTCGKLSDFWDIEEPRFGERNSLGWAEYEAQATSSLDSLRSRILGRSKQQKDALLPEMMPKGLTSKDPVERWRSLDEARADLRRDPARTWHEADWATGELDVDPHAFVFFEELQPLLFPLQSVFAKCTLLDIYAHFVGLSAPTSRFGRPTLDSIWRHSDDTWWPSAITRSRLATTWARVDGEIMERPKSSNLDLPFAWPIALFPYALEELFGNSAVLVGSQRKWFGLWNSTAIDQKRISDAETLLEQASRNSEQDVRRAAALSRLAFASIVQKHKTTVKLARRILSEDRANSMVWLSYAQLQHNAGDVNAARTVYRNMLAQSPAGDTEKAAIAQTWIAWACLEWEAGRHNAARHLLRLAAQCLLLFANDADIEAAIHSTSALAPADLLRARRFYQQNQSVASDSRDPIYVRALATGAALLEYLSAPEDEAFPGASAIFENALQKAMQGTARGNEIAEHIAMAYAKLIWRHVSADVPAASRSRRYRPQEVRAILRRLSLLFPGNTALLALFASMEMSVKFENGLRRALEERINIVCPMKASPMETLGMQLAERDVVEAVWLQYLYCEMHMQAHTVNEHVVRSLFERSVNSEETRNSSLLWRLYVDFETLLCQRCESRYDDAARVQSDERAAARRNRNGPHCDAGRSVSPSSKPSSSSWAKRNTKTAGKALHEARARARRVFYRALQRCPLCKDLYMRAFKAPLRAALMHEELRELARAMDERHLRTFASLDVFLRQQQDAGAAGSDTTNSGSSSDLGSNTDTHEDGAPS